MAEVITGPLEVGNVPVEASQHELKRFVGDETFGKSAVNRSITFERVSRARRRKAKLQTVAEERTTSVCNEIAAEQLATIAGEEVDDLVLHGRGGYWPISRIVPS